MRKRSDCVEVFFGLKTRYVRVDAQDFMTPEDLFATFFGGGPAFHHHHHRGHHDDPQMQRAPRRVLKTHTQESLMSLYVSIYVPGSP